MNQVKDQMEKLKSIINETTEKTAKVIYNSFCIERGYDQKMQNYEIMQDLIVFCLKLMK